MPSTIARPARRSRKIVCGRLHCSECKHWRQTIDFKVLKWSDLAKTRPRYFRPQCETCFKVWKRRYDYERYHRRPGDHTPAEQRRQAAREKREQEQRVRDALGKMCRADRYSFQLEGGLPLSVGWTLSDEDLDPTPVMDVTKTCPGCYLHGGSWCITCPDADVKNKVREAKKQGLILM